MDWAAWVEAIGVVITSIFTAVLASATIRLWNSTTGLQTETKRLAASAERQAEDTRASVAIAQKTAEAAIAAQRPWINFNVGIGSSLVYGDNGYDWNIAIAVSNIGNTPALKILPRAEMVAVSARMPLVFQEAIEKIAKAIKEHKGNEMLKDVGFMLFPKEERKSENYVVKLAKADVENVLSSIGNEKLCFNVMVRVDYEFSGGVGHTSRAYVLWPTVDPGIGLRGFDPKSVTHEKKDLALTAIPGWSSAD